MLREREKRDRECWMKSRSILEEESVAVYLRKSLYNQPKHRGCKCTCKCRTHYSDKVQMSFETFKETFLNKKKINEEP